MERIYYTAKNEDGKSVHIRVSRRPSGKMVARVADGRSTGRKTERCPAHSLQPGRM